ncbi:Hypp2157 [Branchiostoma lanceolatum]|uniref:Hypp2157 protein n=1 Tax=Branchiostoma lanceolatum TaxID=7740 RepID=A0A8J9ZQM2_BRALA|nr:Hypp2157 [Branchiostoma lanceolatum]
MRRRMHPYFTFTLSLDPSWYCWSSILSSVPDSILQSWAGSGTPFSAWPTGKAAENSGNLETVAVDPAYWRLVLLDMDVAMMELCRIGLLLASTCED